MAQAPSHATEPGRARRAAVIRRIDRYELLEQVGSGGMAVVYRGRDTGLDREVAVKVLHPHLAARSEARARFSREARAVARLHHPGIVEIHDYSGDAAVESYLVTEFVRGRTLRAFAEEERLFFPEVAALVVRGLASALAHAHANGVIHRDLKPENVLVSEEGPRPALKIVDFGIARLLASDEKMTMTGALVGSPNHMAPEIIEGREADVRSDVFSLGTILYWMATGAFPFAASNPTATLRKVVEGDYPDPRERTPGVSDELAAVIAAALEREPARRLRDAAALRDALDAALAACGLADPEAELQGVLASPRDYLAALPGRLATDALTRADAALDGEHTATAMRLLDRVLALRPGDAAVEARLQKLARRARVRQVLRRGLAVALLLAVLAVLGARAMHGMRGSEAPLRAGGHRTASPPTAAVAPPAVGPAPARSVAAAAAPGAAATPASSAQPSTATPPPVASVAPGPGDRVVAPAAPAARDASAAARPQGAGAAVAAAHQGATGGTSKDATPVAPAASAVRPGARELHEAAPAARRAPRAPEKLARAAPTAAPGAAAANAPAPVEAATPANPDRGEPTVLSVHVSPYAQRALLDGVEVARGEGRVVFHLAPGVAHRIQIEHACCFPLVRDLPADAPFPTEIKERLRPRPARLRVEGDPRALLFVDGRLVGTAGESQRAPLEVTIPATGESPYEAQAELRLEIPGRPVLRAGVKLRAGADVTFAAPPAGAGEAASGGTGATAAGASR